MNDNTEFSVDQYQLAYPDGIEKNWWHQARNAIVLSELKKIVTPRSTILDVGCGRGIAVKALCQNGLNCRGVELAQTSPLSGIESDIRFGTSASDLPMYYRRQIDIILLLDVIEHIPDSTNFLRSLVDDFPRLQHLIITVPSRSELWSNYDEFYGHVERYDSEMMQDMAEQIQWRISRQSYLFRPLYVPLRMLSTLKIKRNTKLKASSPLTAFANPLIAALMRMDYRFLPNWLPGSSLLAQLTPTPEYLRLRRLNVKPVLVSTELQNAVPEEVSA